MKSLSFSLPDIQTKSFQNFTFILGTLFLMSACGNKTADQITAPEGMCTIELSKYGKAFSIFVPDTSKNPLHINEESSGALSIKAGNTFAITVFEEAADLELKRNDIKTDEVNRFTAYINNEPSAIFWESAITEPEYHFLVNVQLGEKTYGFQDTPIEEGKAPGKNSMQRMFESCKSIQAVSKKE